VFDVRSRFLSDRRLQPWKEAYGGPYLLVPAPDEGAPCLLAAALLLPDAVRLIALLAGVSRLTRGRFCPWPAHRSRSFLPLPRRGVN